MPKNEQKTGKPWPKDCIWPEPLAPNEGMAWEEDWIDPFTIDEDVEDLLEIKEYFDQLVEEGLLDEEYRLNPDFEFDDEDEDFDPEDWEPEKGEEYWFEDQFNLDVWNDDLSNAMNLLKISDLVGKNIDEDPVCSIETAIGYRFINENLLRQAFTRRAFAIEYGINSQLNASSTSQVGCSEELEFLGDSILNIAVTREIMNHHGWLDSSRTSAPYITSYNEGVFSRMKNSFICKEHLAARADELRLGRFILYGSGEKESESAKEDMMEALIGAVAIDSNWDMSALEKLIDRLINLQVDCPDPFLRKSYYDIVNAWHMRHFKCLPDYQVDSSKDRYYGIIRFQIPDNDKGIRTAQLLTAEGNTRSEARTKAAGAAYYFIIKNGLWANLKDCGIVPDADNSINQLQELYQKKYIRELPTYEFSEDVMGGWFCDCFFDSFHTYGKAESKVKAKKQAAFMGLTRLFHSAGLC